MRLNVEPSLAHIDDERRAAYLAAWPVHAQLEAHADAAAGHPEKLNAMMADLKAIKLTIPKP
jgi:hypothetical protein